MNYAQSFDFFGTPVKQIPCILGSGAPTTATEGGVGCFYMDTDNGEVYKCIAVTDNTYTWAPLGGGGGGDADVEAVLDEIHNYAEALIAGGGA